MKNVYRIVVFLAGVVLLIVTVVAATLWTFRQIDEATNTQQHNLAVIHSANDLQSALIDAETSQRGYLLTGDEAFLEQYLALQKSIPGRLDSLRQLTLVSTAEQRLDTLAPLIDAKLMELSQGIELRRNADLVAAQASVSRGEGTHLMESIRAEIANFIQIERDVLAQREAWYQINLRVLLTFMIIASLLVPAFALLFVYLIYRETHHRLKNSAHLETTHLLTLQEEMNKKLQGANDLLLAGEEQLAVTLNSIGDGVIAADAAGRVTLLNPLAEQLTGWSEAEAIGHPVNEIYHVINQQTRQPVADLTMETLTHGSQQGRANNIVLIARTGKERAIADNSAPIRNRDGRVVGAVKVFRDVTERMEIELGLEKTRKELAATKISEDAVREYAESIINTVREPLLALDSDLRVVKANWSFYESFLVTPQETIGNLIYDLGNRQWDIPKLRTLLEDILPKNNKFDDYEVEHEFSNIGHKIMLLNARRITQKEIGSQLILLAIEDTTEKIRLQRELAERTRTAEQAQSVAELATRAKSDFLANMSHELRTPLNSIIGFSEVLEDELLGPLNDSQRENVGYILRAGRHLLSLINDILDLSKVEAGRMDLEVNQVSLREVLDSSLVMHREKALRHHISLNLDMEPRTDRVIEVDERKLKQILFNLMSNAVKFTPDGGSVRVWTKEVSDAQEIEIGVEDTGIGIKPEDIPKLFKGFSQLESAYDKRYEGTGLGLALTKKFVELQGGHIRVTSEFGQGSQFTFGIPQKSELKKDV